MFVNGKTFRPLGVVFQGGVGEYQSGPLDRSPITATTNTELDFKTFPTRHPII